MKECERERKWKREKEKERKRERVREIKVAGRKCNPPAGLDHCS